jgi:hypothetical protein
LVRPGRHTTVLAGIGLGVVLVTVLTIAGAVGLDPLPGFDAGMRQSAPGSALSASQPEVRRSLLTPGDLPPGYSVTPAASAAGGGHPAETGQGTRPAEPGHSPSGGGLLPDLGLGDLPLDDGILGGPTGPVGSGPSGNGPSGNGPSGNGPSGNGPSGNGPSGNGPDGRPEVGAPESAGRACRSLLARPWRVAAAGHRPVAPPQVADHLDRERGVRLRQVLGGFAADGAVQAIARVRRIAAACPRFRLGRQLIHHNGDSASGTVTLEPTPAAAPVDGGGDGYALRVSIVADDGRAWTGYLAVDRVGRVLSVLLHLGPRGVVGPEEAAATRRAAVAKARPLDRLLADGAADGGAGSGSPGETGDSGGVGGGSDHGSDRGSSRGAVR